jgi:cysteine synthase A
MFALEWCEFCWSGRKVFAEYGLPYKSGDIDSVEYAENNRGGKLRVALRNHTTWNTFPQIFINGEFLGGCTDLFDGLKDASLIDKLKAQSIPIDTSKGIDPYEFLPKWLHARK